MKITNVAVVGLVMLGTLGLVVACQMLSSASFLPIKGKMQVGACGLKNTTSVPNQCRLLASNCRQLYGTVVIVNPATTIYNVPMGCSQPIGNTACPAITGQRTTGTEAGGLATRSRQCSTVYYNYSCVVQPINQLGPNGGVYIVRLCNAYRYGPYSCGSETYTGPC